MVEDNIEEKGRATASEQTLSLVDENIEEKDRTTTSEQTRRTLFTAEASPYAPPQASITVNKGKEDNKDYELWNPNAAANWSLLFTPIFGAWLQSQNWEELGEDDKARASKMWMYITPVVIIIGMLIGVNLGFIILITWYVVEGRKQANHLKENDIDYTKKPWGKVLGLATFFLIAFFGFLVLIVMLFE